MPAAGPGAGVVANMAAKSDKGSAMISAFTIDGRPKTTSVEITFTSGTWRSVGTSDDPTKPADINDKDLGQFAVSAAQEEEGNAQITVEQAVADPGGVMLLAVDAAGTQHHPHRVKVQSDGDHQVTAYGYDLSIKDIKSLQLLARTPGEEKTVLIRGISLEKGKTTKPQFIVR